MFAVSIVIPAYMEGDAIGPVLSRIVGSVQSDVELLVVVDFEEDTTVRVVRNFAKADKRVHLLVSTFGRGPANAIRFGIEHANHSICVITMADGSDDPQQIDALARLVDRGVVVASASRYSSGGQQIGGPFLKSMLSRGAGRSLGRFARVGTYDATNSFKAYATDFVRSVQIHSRSGFEIGLELTAKARRLRLPVAEVPTIWLDRTQGASNFEIAKWLPKYLRWYWFAFGPQLTLDEVIRAADRIALRNDGSLNGGIK